VIARTTAPRSAGLCPGIEDDLRGRYGRGTRASSRACAHGDVHHSRGVARSAGRRLTAAHLTRHTAGAPGVCGPRSVKGDSGGWFGVFVGWSGLCRRGGEAEGEQVPEAGAGSLDGPLVAGSEVDVRPADGAEQDLGGLVGFVERAGFRRLFRRAVPGRRGRAGRRHDPGSPRGTRCPRPFAPAGAGPRRCTWPPPVVGGGHRGKLQSSPVVRAYGAR